MQLKNTTGTCLGLPQGISIDPGETHGDVPEQLEDGLFVAAWLERGMLVVVQPKQQSVSDTQDA